MGAKLKVAGRTALLAGCAAALVGATAGSALADLKPQRPPPHHGALRPDPVPGASSPRSVVKTALSTQTQQPVIARSSTPRTTAPAYVAPTPRTSAAPRSSVRSTSSKQRARPAGGTHRLWPDVRRGAASLTSVRALPGSRRSWLVLAAGLGLVLLVIGETTFLRLSGAWFGLPAPARSRSTRPPEPAVAIRQVRPRR
jgi:hypothetical protein